VLEVTDTGIGMAPEKVSVLSQPFAFSDASLARDREGPGLGLAIARRLVESWGASISVQSAPRKGAEFVIEFSTASALDA